MSMRYSETQVFEDIFILETYVRARKSENSGSMATALSSARTILKPFKIGKPDLCILYSLFTRIHYVATFIKLQRTPTGRKPSGTNDALASARRIEGWILQLAGPDFPELSQEPVPSDKSQKVTLDMWHYIVNN